MPSPPPGTHGRTAVPRPPPHSASTTLSVSSWRTIRPRPAPSAVRTAISRARAAPRASSRFATLPHAISSTRPDRCEQRQQPLPDVADELLDERHRPEADGLVVFWKIVTQARRPPRRALPASAATCSSRLQAAVDGEVVLVVHRPLRRREGDRRPQLFAVGGQIERLRHHAGDLVGHAVHPQRAADRRVRSRRSAASTGDGSARRPGRCRAGPRRR